jgi:phosphoribosylanthranilate isomerase
MSALPFQIKICGITNADDALAAVRARADAIGLNFYARSKRFISVENAMSVVRDVPREIVKVGVFVNPSPAEVNAVMNAGVIDFVQLHGDETPELLAELSDLPIIKAVRWDSAASPELLANFLAECKHRQCVPAALLMDANIAGEFGGTGTPADWKSIAKWRQETASAIPIVLAGGLTADNVGAAITAVHPEAVDTASGVEISPCKKSESLITSFVAAARKAYTSGSQC